MSAFNDLMAHQRETGALAQVAGRLGWDQETVMPAGAGDQRAEEQAAMESVLHARRTDPRIGDWLAAIDAATLDEDGRAQIRHIRWNYARAQAVPADLATALARLTSRAHQAWATARESDDFKGFAPLLAEVVALKREEGAAHGGDPYDALLQDYEPGASAAQLGEMFGALRPRLVALRAACLDAPQPEPLTGSFEPAQQMALAQRLAGVFGYDFSRGRIDKAVHPFSAGSGDDVRITTRTAFHDPLNCIYSTIHETGHACYEQAIRPAYRQTPLGEGVSMGVHESQSRIYENQLGRSRAFTGWLHGAMHDVFGSEVPGGPEAFYRAVNRLENNFIRTEADEVQYNLHVLLRFDLEQALISGDLAVSDLEAAWNDRFKADFGFDVDKPSHGVLQDVHWSAGLFGYFATYTLGNVYAGCLNEHLRTAVPALDDQLGAGDLSAATGWLRDNVQQYGGLYEPREVIARACGGAAPSEEPLLRYLEAKFGDLYGL